MSALTRQGNIYIASSENIRQYITKTPNGNKIKVPKNWEADPILVYQFGDFPPTIPADHHPDNCRLIVARLPYNGDRNEDFLTCAPLCSSHNKSTRNMSSNLLSVAPNAEDLEREGQSLLGQMYARQPDWVGGAISKYDAGFLAGLVRHLDARRIVEVGVASGWSSGVMIAAQKGVGHVTGIDLSPTYYLDPSHPTGAVVSELFPDQAHRFTLLTGACAFEIVGQIGSVDFAFIDGHHKHPWAALDLISLLPRLERGAWVGLHDLSLCHKPEQNHSNRGPFYLYYMWPGRKLRSTQEPTMIGAIHLEEEPMDYLPFLCEILHTPWELDLTPEQKAAFLAFTKAHFDATQQSMLRQAIGSSQE
jgi:predicted O-methyltransferase YrrM